MSWPPSGPFCVLLSSDFNVIILNIRDTKRHEQMSEWWLPPTACMSSRIWPFWLISIISIALVSMYGCTCFSFFFFLFFLQCLVVTALFYWGLLFITMWLLFVDFFILSAWCEWNRIYVTCVFNTYCRFCILYVLYINIQVIHKYTYGKIKLPTKHTKYAVCLCMKVTQKVTAEPFPAFICRVWDQK